MCTKDACIWPYVHRSCTYSYEYVHTCSRSVSYECREVSIHIYIRKLGISSHADGGFTIGSDSITMAMALLVIVHKSMQWTAWKSLPLARWFRSSAVGCLSGKSGRLPRPSTVLQVSVPHHQKTFHLKWKLGESIKDLAEQNEDLMAEYIEGVCGGNLSCSTCHVYIHQPEFKELLEEPSESEADMLVR